MITVHDAINKSPNVLYLVLYHTILEDRCTSNLTRLCNTERIRQDYIQVQIQKLFQKIRISISYATYQRTIYMIHYIINTLYFSKFYNISKRPSACICTSVRFWIGCVAPMEADTFLVSIFIMASAHNKLMFLIKFITFTSRLLRVCKPRPKMVNEAVIYSKAQTINIIRTK